MSRLAKKPIIIPTGVEINVSAGLISIKGPKGNISKQVSTAVAIESDGKEVKITGEGAILGTVASHINNMFEGVTKGFEKKMQIEGIGFKGEVKDTEAIFNLGFSHQIKLTIPKGLTVAIERGVITVSGINKEEVGAFAAKIRSYKKPEPYKGKGIRYVGEQVKIKQGKKSA